MGSPAAAGISDEEREFVLELLESSRRALADSIAHLTPAQWTFRPDPESWSAAECAEHIPDTEERIVRLLEAAPCEPQRSSEVAGKERKILRAVPDRSRRVKAPPELEPSGRFETPTALIGHVEQVRARTVDYAVRNADGLRNRFVAHPVFGTLDGYQWMLMVAKHTERHTLQIEEIKAHTGFPRA